jgi:hypothetical protein
MGSTQGANPYVLLNGKLNESIWITNLQNTSSNLSDLVAIKKYIDSQMLLCCLFQADLMGISDKGSYALGETQQDLVGRNINAIVQLLKNTHIQQIVKPILQLNFNEQEDFGTFEKVDNVSEDQALNLDKINSLTNLGIKLKLSAICSLMDIEEDAIESIGNPIIGQDLPDGKNQGVNSNFKRSGSNVG